MTRTVVGHYVSADDAQRALDQLEQAGFTKDDVSYVAHDGSGRFADLLRGKVSPGSGTAKGAVSGLFLGLAAMAIPGVGPAVAAGPISLALVGAATGGLLGALADMGVPEKQAKEWSERVSQGGSLVIVRAEAEKVDRARDVIANTAEDVRVHDADEVSDTGRNDAFGNFGDEGGSSQWGQRVLRVEGDDTVVVDRAVTRDKGTKSFDETGKDRS